MRQECRERFSRHRFKKCLGNDSGMYHGTCVTHLPSYMSRSLTRGGGENVPAFPAHAQPGILCIWQQAHGRVVRDTVILYRFIMAVDSIRMTSTTFFIYGSIILQTHKIGTATGLLRENYANTMATVALVASVAS